MGAILDGDTRAIFVVPKFKVSNIIRLPRRVSFSPCELIVILISRFFTEQFSLTLHFGRRSRHHLVCGSILNYTVLLRSGAYAWFVLVPSHVGDYL